MTTDRMEPLFRFCTDAVCAVEGERIFYANPAARTLFGRDVTGESAEAVFPLLMLAPETETAASSLRLGGREYPVTAQNAGEFFLLTVRIVPGERESIPGSALQQLRSGMFALRVALERLVSQSGKKAQPCGEAAMHCCYSLLRQVRHLSELEELRRGDMLLRMEPLELGGLTAELLDSVRTLLGDGGAELRLLGTEEPLVVLGDREKLTEMLLGLLLNGLQHTPAGGHITVELVRKGKNALLTVSDEGEGLAGDKMGTLFSPEGESGLNAVGAGLGLSLVQGIARVHGGNAVAESRRGRGARLCVTLPLSGDLHLRDHAPYRVSGTDILLTELSPVLKNELYGAKYRD